MRLLILLILGLSIFVRATASDKVAQSLYKSLEENALPYGVHEITEQQLVSTYGSGCVLVAANTYKRRVFYDAASKLWVEFAFSPDERGNPLTLVVLSALDMKCARVAPKRAINIPPTIRCYFGMTQDQLAATFPGRELFKREQFPPYVPKVSGPIFAPSIKDDIVVPIVLYFDNKSIAAVEIAAP
jgi:hypothetical protein